MPEHYYGCLFCITGQEDELLKQLTMREGLNAISPVRKHYYRKKGKVEINEDKVFPGYLFFMTEDAEFSERRLITLKGVIKLLRYDSKEWILQGEDAEFAKLLFKCNGVIGLSKARFENNRLRIIDGFLKPYENEIRKVDRRHKVAMIRTKINNKVMELWLGYYLADS